jgi:hypothetical protein
MRLNANIGNNQVLELNSEESLKGTRIKNSLEQEKGLVIMFNLRKGRKDCCSGEILNS